MFWGIRGHNIFKNVPLKHIMPTHELHQQISSRLEQLRDMHREMQAHSSSIPYAEIDLFLQKVRQLYEASLLLHHHNALKTMEELESAIAERYAKTPEAPRVQPVHIDMVKPVVVESPAQPVQAPTASEPVATAAPIPEKTEVPVHPMDELIAQTLNHVEAALTPASAQKAKKISGDLHEMFEEKPTLGDKFEDQETLGERMVTNHNSPRVAERLQRKPVKDLKAAIGINEKFQFINQLFGGDAPTYHSSVEHLNTCGSLAAATGYVQTQLVQKYRWDLGTAPASLFMDLVERRFLA